MHRVSSWACRSRLFYWVIRNTPSFSFRSSPPLDILLEILLESLFKRIHSRESIRNRESPTAGWFLASTTCAPPKDHLKIAWRSRSIVYINDCEGCRWSHRIAPKMIQSLIQICNTNYVTISVEICITNLSFLILAYRFGYTNRYNKLQKATINCLVIDRLATAAQSIAVGWTGSLITHDGSEEYLHPLNFPR